MNTRDLSTMKWEESKIWVGSRLSPKTLIQISPNHNIIIHQHINKKTSMHHQVPHTFYHQNRLRWKEMSCKTSAWSLFLHGSKWLIEDHIRMELMLISVSSQQVHHNPTTTSQTTSMFKHHTCRSESWTKCIHWKDWIPRLCRTWCLTSTWDNA